MIEIGSGLTPSMDQPERRIPLNQLAAVLQAVLQHRHFIAICLVTTLIIRLAWIFLIQAQPVSDFRWYYERGTDFAAGRGYSVDAEAFWPSNIPPRVLDVEEETIGNRSLTAYWPVGYPAFLGLLFTLFGPSLLIAKIANVILYLGILFFSYALGKMLFGSELVGRVTLLVLAFYPDHIAYSSLLASETLFLFLLLLGLLLLIISQQKEPKQALGLGVIAGIVFGLVCLIKPQTVLVPALFFTVILFGRVPLLSCLKQAFIVYLALGLTLMPWLVRNYQLFDAFIISNNGGYNLLVGNNPRATGTYVFNKEMVAMLSEARTERERDQKAQKLALNYIMGHPLETLKRWPKKLWYLYHSDTMGIYWNEQGLKAEPESLNLKFLSMLRIIAQLYYMGIGALAFLSILAFIRSHKTKIRQQPLLTLGLWLVLYFTLVSLLTFGDSRFHFMIVPWIVMYIGLLIEILLKLDYQRGNNPIRSLLWN